MTAQPPTISIPCEQEPFADRMIREAEERGHYADAAQWRRIQEAVDKAPPLTQQQKDRLRILLAPAAPARSA